MSTDAFRILRPFVVLLTLAKCISRNNSRTKASQILQSACIAVF